MTSVPDADAAVAHRFAIDMRHYEPHERVPLLELSLSVLKPGDSVEVIFPSWPGVLVRHLERHYADRCQWWPGRQHDEWYSLVIRAGTPHR